MSMKSTLPSMRRFRTSSVMLGVVLLSGAMLASAAPANAVVDELYDVTGTVSVLDAEGDASTVAGIEVFVYSEFSSTPRQENTAADGTFTFTGLEDGNYALDLVPDSLVYGYQSFVFTIDGGDVVLDPIVLLPYLDKGTIGISGDYVVGEDLTISTGGWPSGVTLTYQWGYNDGESGSTLHGATSPTLTLTKDLIGYRMSAFVTAEKNGFAATQISVFPDEVVSTPRKTAAPAPVKNSDDLASYLAGKDAEPQPQDAAGLPAGPLDPSKSYEAALDWSGQDSFVDAYLYSTPILVGTFPVVNGVAMIDLSADVLSELSAGGHTLVVVGQTSGNVRSVQVDVDTVLASTGVDPLLAFSASGFFLLLGAASLIAARRMRSKS